MFVYVLMLMRHRTRLKTGDLLAPAKTSTTRAVTKCFLLILVGKSENQIMYVFGGSKTTKSIRKLWEQLLETRKNYDPKSQILGLFAVSATKK